MKDEGDESFGIDATIETEEEFWDELDDVVSTPCRSHDRIDDTLRTWVALTTGPKYREEFVQTEDDVARCALKLLESELYQKHSEYVRLQLIHGLLQEDDPCSLHIITAFLLFDGMRDDTTFELMVKEGMFIRLIQLIGDGIDDELGLHRQLLELLYQMSRIQQLSWDDLNTIDDDFVLYLFKIVEGLSNDANDPYHYPTIRVLLVLNEQYMVLAHDPHNSKHTRTPITNRVIKALSKYGSDYKTFGENIILLLNRERETSLQLLILKVLYLLFTTPSTREYFYTNDLHVLVDILIRNLLDLPGEISRVNSGASGSLKHEPTSPRTSTSSLRHTYLRVLHPLLAHTQLRYPPHYKREQLRKTLFLLADASHGHFDRPDDTTVRLVGRCISVEWLHSKDDDDAAAAAAAQVQQQSDSTPATPILPSTLHMGGDGGIHNHDHSVSASVRAGQAVVAKKLLGMRLPEAQESSISVAEVAAQTAEPGVMTPSRRGAGEEMGLVAGKEMGLGLVRQRTRSSEIEDPGGGEGDNPFGDDDE